MLQDLQQVSLTYLCSSSTAGNHFGEKIFFFTFHCQSPPHKIIFY